MKLPRGSLVRRRVITDPGTVLATALDEELTGYARLESQDALLLDASGVGVVTFEAGVPVVAYHTGTDRGGPAALADLAVDGPYRLELFELAPDALGAVHAEDSLRVPPGMPAARLAGDPGLADRTRAAAPEERSAPAGDSPARQPGAVEAFLEDEAKIEAIRERARAEASERAAEWGL